MDVSTMKSLESLSNSVIKTALYMDHWYESINRRYYRQELRNLNNKIFWKTPEARERRLKRRELKTKSDKFFMKTYWHLDNFFNGFNLVKNNSKQPTVLKSLHREVQSNRRFLAYLFALDRSFRKEIFEKFISGMKAVRLKRRSLIKENEFVNWDDEEGQDLTGENIFNLQELFGGYPPYEPIHPLVIQIQRFHKQLELENIWGPLTMPENVINLRELFRDYDTELLTEDF